MRSTARALALASLSLWTAGTCAAQSWPSRQIFFIVPFAAGGGVDAFARPLAAQLDKQLGQRVLIENRAGAGGTAGAALAAKAAPDGYTFLFATTGPAATNKLMYKDMTYDPQKDLAPVGLLGKSPIIIVARADLPAANLQEFIALTKKPQASFSVGYPGNGTLGHVTGAMLQTTIKATFADAQYRGSAQIMNDLLGGHIDLGMDSMAAYVPQVEAGKLKALAIASAKRWPKLPQVPTVSESGLPGFEASVWYAILAPIGVNADISTRLNGYVNSYLTEDKTRTLFTELGIETGGGSSADLAKFIDSELVKWGPVIKAAKIDF